MLYDPNWKPADIKVEPWQQLLLDAAALIETKGWCQGDYKTKAGYCAVGAIAYAAAYDGNSYNGDTMPRARTALRNIIGQFHIAGWNDKPERTAQEVISALRAATECRL